MNETKISYTELIEDLEELDSPTVGETVSYEDWEKLEEEGRADIQRWLRTAGLRLHDNGCEMEVVWQFAKDGSRLDPDRDDVYASEQPETAAE